jgi:hypothetical protein
MTASVWFQMLWQNRFEVAPAKCYLVLLITLASLFNSLLAGLQIMLFGKRIERSQLRPDPIIILGHWRSGTTLLHELLSLDRRHHYPSTYACLAPDHFLISRILLSRCLRYLMPNRRSQDNVRIAFDTPQEDEWAICSMGLPSPYLAVGFPNRSPHAAEYLNLRDVTAGDLGRWKRKWRRFLQAVSLQAPGKRLVLKSPLHTARITALLELFPDARFVHIVRDPKEVYLSTMRLWQRLAEDEGLQIPEPGAFDELVLENFRQLYQSYEQDANLIAEDHLCEIRYENLVGDPLGTVQEVYSQLGLGDFNDFRLALEEHVAEASEFQTNCYRQSSKDDAVVEEHLRSVRLRFGYSESMSPNLLTALDIRG